MPISVPTAEEFAALEGRVAKLENPAAPIEPPVDPGTGVQAKRVADAIELFGVNTFSSMDADANQWGSWPADYTPASVIDALKWIQGDSGFQLRIREYHYTGRTAMQR